MARLLRYLILEPLRWAIQEIWQWIIAIGLLAGAWWIGHASGGRWWLGLLLGATFVGAFLAVSAWIMKSTGEDEAESAS